ncbi:MAG: PQQ-dependent sugar dehydrogenase [Actinomycetota bacterium]
MRRGLTLALVALLLAAGCSDGDEGAGGRSPEPSPPPPPAPQPTLTPDLARFRGRLVRIATLREPLAFAVRAEDDSIYIGQKPGQIVAIRGGTVARQPILDLGDQVSQGGEQGLLGLAFSPGGEFLYVNYTDLAGDTHVTEFSMLGDTADEGSARDVLFIDQPFSNHNGGHLTFGSDGFLYVGLGDGGSAGDPMDNSQNLESLLGKILRIDPRPTGGTPYGIPTNNPFVGQEGARPEVWAYGLRNPWRFSFDRLNGDLWIADAGQERREEIDRQAGFTGGQNYGWDGYEGTLVHEEPLPLDVEDPVYEYGDDLGSAAVIGGYVYRGSLFPALRGAYVFGDFYNPDLRALIPSPGGGLEEAPLGLTVPNLSAFGEDAAGELYALSLSGQVYRLVP